MKAIILDGHQKSALAAIRSLGEKNISFSVGSERGTAAGFYSRHTTDSFVYTSPLIDKEKFVDEVIAEAQRLKGKSLIYAFSDATALALIRHRIRIEKVATLLYPDTPEVETAFNKRKVLELAKTLDIRIPVTNFCDDLDDISALSKKLAYPAIVKPQHTATWKEKQGFTGHVFYAHNSAELTSYAARVYNETGEYPLVQTFINGPELGVELICKKGVTKASVIHKRIRSLKPRGGASVVKETMKEDETTREILRSSKELARMLKWDGVMMVEFKVNEKSEKPFLMEINGRFWGSLPLAIFANIDFPIMYYRMAKGEDLGDEIITHTPNVRSRHFLGDLNNLFLVLFKNDPLREELYPNRWDATIDFFRGNGQYYDVFSLRDPLPFFMEIVDVIYRSFKK